MGDANDVSFDMRIVRFGKGLEPLELHGMLSMEGELVWTVGSFQAEKVGHVLSAVLAGFNVEVHV